MPHRPTRRVTLSGHVTLSTAQDAFDDLGRSLPPGERCDVLVDMTGATGYDEDARRRFAEVWAPVWAGCLRRVAVAESRPDWRMVTAAMSPATEVRLRAFGSVEEAERWLGEA